MMPMIRRIPKRGFHNKWGVNVAVLNVERSGSGLSVGGTR